MPDTAKRPWGALLGQGTTELDEMLVIEVTNSTMRRTPAPDLYDVPLLQVVPTSHA